MRVTAGEHWIDLRDVTDLTWADQEAWDDAFDEALTAAQNAAIDPETGQRRVVMAPDGVSMVPVTVRPQVTPDLLRRRRDTLIASLITGWSFDVPLPFTPEAKPMLPQSAARALNAALEPYFEALQGSPKEAAPSTATSGSSSGARPQTSPKG